MFGWVLLYIIITLKNTIMNESINLTKPRYKSNKFDPRTLKPFDKIITRVEGGIWFCELLTFIGEGRNIVKGLASYYNYCVPYNEETEHLIGITDEAPEYYRYWK